MLSKLRKSFRRKSSRNYHRRRSDTNTDDDADTIGNTSFSSSFTSLNSSVSTKLNGTAPSVHSPRHPSPNPDTQWQKVTPSVIESNRTMFNRQLNCDVIFVVGDDGGLVGAHRFVLLSRSDVFFRMFCGPMAETGPVVIPDVTEDVFRQFLEFLYVDEVSLTPDNVTPLHYLGRKYDVEPLVQQCLEFLHARLTCDNACSILEQAHCFDEHELYKTSFEFVKENVQACLTSVAVHDLCRNCFERLLAVDDLDISELPLFKAALAWAEASLEKKHVTIDADHVRKELGPILRLIRFPAMTSDVLKERVFPTGVLTPEEVKVIVEYKERSRPSADPFVYSGRKRLLQRFQSVARVRCSSKTEAARWTAAITFSCDRDFFLHGIHVYSCTRETQHANMKFSVLQGHDEVDLFNRMSDTYDHTYVLNGDIDGIKTLAITIGAPLPLCAKAEYTLVLQANMASCFTGTDGMACITCDDVIFRFRDAPVKMNGTTVIEGQIPCLVYSLR